MSMDLDPTPSRSLTDGNWKPSPHGGGTSTVRCGDTIEIPAWNSTIRTCRRRRSKIHTSGRLVPKATRITARSALALNGNFAKNGVYCLCISEVGWCQTKSKLKRGAVISEGLKWATILMPDATIIRIQFGVTLGYDWIAEFTYKFQ
jgi:hypothetical protein